MYFGRKFFFASLIFSSRYIRYSNADMNYPQKTQFDTLLGNPSFKISIRKILHDLLEALAMDNALVCLYDGDQCKIIAHYNFVGQQDETGEFFPVKQDWLGRQKIGHCGSFQFQTPILIQKEFHGTILLSQPRPSASPKLIMRLLPYCGSTVEQTIEISMRLLTTTDDLNKAYAHIGGMNLKMNKLERLYQVLGGVNRNNREEVARDLLDAAVTISNAEVGYLFGLHYPGPKISHKFRFGAHTNQLLNELPLHKLMSWTQNKKNNILDIKTKHSLWKCIKSASAINNIQALLLCRNTSVQPTTTYSLKAIVEQAQLLFAYR